MANLLSACCLELGQIFSNTVLLDHYMVRGWMSGKVEGGKNSVKPGGPKRYIFKESR